jgi:hypothetical protein
MTYRRRTLRQPEQTPRAIIARHLNGAGEVRRAAMESARTGQVVGFYGPEGHKDSARGLLADVRSRRLTLASQESAQ